MRGLVVVVLLSMPLAGCLGANEPVVPPVDPVEDALSLWDAYLAALDVDPAAAVMPEILDAGLEDRPRVVVAVVDSGVNPFHTFFRRDATLAPGSVPVPALDATTDIPARYVPIRPISSFQEEAMWLGDAVAGETLYRFAGTNLFYYSTSDEVETVDYSGHGTATAATVLANAPDAYVVAVQTTGENLTKSIQWAAAQPWIDVVSVSWGCTANCVHGTAQWQTQGFPDSIDASRAVWSAGKLYVNSAGNDPTPHHFDARDGPPWVIAAGGADPFRRGEAVLASKLVDVVANFTVFAPDHDDVEAWHDTSGTSFAAPTVAGTLADAILGLRTAVGHTGGIQHGSLAQSGDTHWRNADVRHAMNQSAVYWEPTDYDVQAPHPDPIGAGIPVLAGAPWIQMGWGFVDRSISATMVTMLVEGTGPSKDPMATAYMAQQQAVREALWT